VPEPRLQGLRVERLLGQGGFGAVFEAARGDGQRVAIKVARADQASASERLVLEAEALMAIGVPHVPAVFGSGRLPDGSVYVVMEYVKAPILGDVMAELDAGMPLAAFAARALPIIGIMKVAHTLGFVHCDLKPENVFVDASFGAKLFDFGLVRRIGKGTDESTREEAPAGTAEYMSPEQCEGRVDIDARSDLYALGVIFYEMLAGSPPFFGNAAEVQQSHRSRRPPSLGRKVAIPLPIEAVIMRCLAKDRERRFASASDLEEALRLALSEAPAAEPAPASQPSSGEAKETGPAPGASSAPAAAAAPAAKPAAAARERRAVALAFFESKSNVAVVRDALVSVGAHLAHTAGAQFAAAFGHEVGDNPTRSAAAAAEMFIGRGLCKRVLVDLASVSIQARPDGSRRYQSPLFTRKEQYPTEDDPAGVLLSAGAVEVLPDVPGDPIPNRPGVMLMRKVTQASERTATRVSSAPPMVGREALMRSLMEMARTATSTLLPTITTLIGEVGYGKTAAAQSLVQNLESIPSIDTIFIRAKEVLGGVGDQTTREIFARTLKLPDAAPADLGRALLSELLGADVARDVWAGVAVTMGWAPPEHPELRAQAAAPGALRSAAARAAGEGLRLMARQRPVALVLDDAQFVDETTLDALEYASLKEAGCPIWICVIGRPAFGRGRTAWASRAASRHELTLPALEPAAAAELARRLLSPAENVPATALARLAERTQGIPMLLVELVRGLKRDGLVRRSEKGSTWFLATDELERLPDLPLVQWLSSRELESLPPDLLAHARLASLLGVEFTADDLEGVLQELERTGAWTETQLDASVGLQRLKSSGILVGHRRGRVGFRHSLLRDTVYQSVPPAQRETIHRAAYTYCSRRIAGEEERLPEMAFHAARSGLTEEAGRIYLGLAERALARHQYLDAELLYRNALENLSDSDDVRQISASKGLGLMRFRLGRHEDAIKDFVASRARAHKAAAQEAEIEIALDQSIVLDWIYDWPQSAALVAEADSLATGPLRTPAVEARLLFGKARSLHRSDRIEEAARLFEKTIALAETLGDSGYESFSQSLSLLAWEYAVLGRHADSEAVFERTMKVFEEHGDMINLAGVLLNRCMLSLLINNVDRMLDDYKRTITIAREGGFPLLECTAHKDISEVYYLLGRTEDAETHVHRAIEMYAQIVSDNARTISSAETLLARMAIYRGDVATARSTLGRVQRRQEEAGASGRTENELSPAEKLLVSMVDLVIRQAPESEWDALAAAAHQITLQPQDMVEIMEMRGISALRSGRHRDGIRLLEAAYAEGEKNAKIMSDRVRRQLEHARTQAAS
jgi:tetratricopeptide (TPR) repeat protein